MSELGRYLRARRDELGLNRQRVADATGLSYAYLQQLESGAKSSPSATVLGQLASVLQVPYEELARRAGVRDVPPRRRAVADAGLTWHDNPAHVDAFAVSSYEAEFEESSLLPPSTSSELAAARSRVLPALERLLEPYSPATRLAVLHELQARAIAELGAR